MKKTEDTLSITASRLRFQISSEVHFENFSYTFEPGRIYIFKGRSGCGKTTLLSMLAGYIRPTGGKVLYSPAVRRSKIAFFSESSLCFNDLTVLENLALFHKDRNEIASVLNLVGLEGKEKQKASSLSKGETARLAIARTILSDSTVLFFDEPTANLDSENGARIFSILRALSRTKLVLVATQEEVAYEESDVLFRYHGDTLSFDEEKPEIRKDAVPSGKEYSLSLPRPDRPRPSFKILAKFLGGIARRSWKQLLLLIPVLCVLLFMSFLSLSVTQKTGNEILYESMAGHGIAGSVLETFAEGDDRVFLGTGAVAPSDGTVYFAAVPQSPSFSYLGNTYELASANETVLPSSLASKYGLKAGDKASFLVLGEERELTVRDIYVPSEPVFDGVFKDISEDTKSTLRKVNAPLFLSSELLDAAASSQGVTYFCSREFLLREDALSFGPAIRAAVDSDTAQLIEHKTNYDRIWYWILGGCGVLFFASLYFLSVTASAAFQKETAVFKMSRGTLASPFWVLTAFSLASLILSGAIFGIVLASVRDPLNKFLSDFYASKGVLNFFGAPEAALLFAALLFLLLVLSSLLNLFFVFLRYKNRMKRKQ